MHDAITVGISRSAHPLWHSVQPARPGQARNRLEKRMDTMQASLSRFYLVLGEHSAKFEMMPVPKK
jgi:hypothetical protein